MGLPETLQTYAWRNPDGLALVDGQRERTWAGLRDRTRALAGHLRTRLSAGDRLLVLSGNRVEVIETYLACAAARVIAAPVNPTLADSELEYAISKLGPAAAVGDPAGLARLETLLPDTPRWDIAAEYLPSVAGPASSLTAPFAILQTSATTGRPKGVVIDQRSIQLNALSWLADVRPRPGTRFLQAGPLFHGSMVIALDYLAAGCPVHVLERFVPQSCLRAIETWAIEHAFLVPSMVRLLLETRQVERADLGSLRLLLHGAAPMPTDLADEARKVLRVDLQTIYGITEGGGAVLTLAPEDTPGTPAVGGATCIGVPMTGTVARIRDDDGADLGPGEIGTLHLSGDGLMHGYWSGDNSITDGWLNTGDIAYTDERGYFWIIDRRNDLILRGGQNVYPAEIERVLRNHPSVVDVAVVPAASTLWGQIPVAFVQTCGDVAERDLAAHCVTFLASYKRPGRFVFVDAIPRSPAGKILRRLLRERADEAARVAEVEVDS
jgi:acyl-CoA synthetase (AMP-forming)/AMP-acid ligase II